MNTPIKLYDHPKLIDEILSFLNEKPQPSDFRPFLKDKFDDTNGFNTRDLYEDSVKVLEENELIIKRNNNSQYDITSKGIEVLEIGYVTWKDNQKEEVENLKIRELEVHSATLASADSAKKSMIASYVAIAISIFLAGYQWYDSNNKQSEIDLINKNLDSLSSSILKIQKLKTTIKETKLTSPK
jgi:hypothetical protein